MSPAAPIAFLLLGFLLAAAMWLCRTRGQQETCVSEAQRYRREQVAMRMHGEANYGEWWVQ